jgi:glycosyltransferase involved in cell wall biosynthesis
MPGCREIVRDGENGLLVPSRDVNALTAALARLIEDAELRRRLGARGRAIAAAGFGVEVVVGETLAVYRSLVP